MSGSNRRKRFCRPPPHHSVNGSSGRETRFELATCSLEGCHATIALLPLKAGTYSPLAGLPPTCPASPGPGDLWTGLDLNQRTSSYEPGALPTELPVHGAPGRT